LVFEKDAVTAGALADSLDSAAAMQQLFNFLASGHTDGVGSYLSAAIRRDGLCQVQYYDIEAHLDGSPHGSPIKTVNFDILDPIGTETVPAEAAAVITLYAVGRGTQPVRITNPTPPPEFIRPKQRRTGRVYLGPLNSSAFAASGGEVYLATAFINAMKAGIEQVTTQATAVGAHLMVWSRADAAVRQVTGGVIDNAPDTQRRRGVSSTARTVWTSH